MKCKICDKDFKILGRHIYNFHSLMSKEYYDKYLKKENEGKCILCGRQTLYSRNIKRGYFKFCSESCAGSYYGNLEEQKAVRRQNMVNYYSNKNNREKASIRIKKSLNNSLTKAKMSIRATERIIKRIAEKPDSFGFGFYKTGYFLSQKNNCNIYYASSYELRAYEILEQLNAVKSFGRCRFSIDYINPNDAQMHKYLPDVLVEYNDGSKQIIEIKPSNLLANETVMAKASAAQTHCDANDLNYTIWTEKDLN